MRRWRDRVDTRSDDGAVLLLALAFLAVFGIVVAALLAQSDVSLKTTGVVTAKAKSTYSADSGIDLGLEAVQTDPTICPEQSAGVTTVATSLVVDGDAPPVTVTCRTTDDGSSGGWRGYAVVTTSTAADSLRTQSGPTKTVTGGVFVNGGVNLQRDVEVVGANFVQNGTPCDAGRARALPAPPYSYSCPAARSIATLGLDTVVVPPQPGSAAAPVTTGDCTVFSPGTYSSIPVLTDRNYFKSGVYYFTYSGQWVIDRDQVVAGAPALDENGAAATTYLDAPCSGAETNPSGRGVSFVFTGQSRMAVSNNARVEIHARQLAPGESYTPRLSILVRGPRTAGAALDQLNGNPQVVIHGTVFSKDAEVGTNAVGGVSFFMLNSVVASKLFLQSTGDGLRVKVDGTSDGRTVLIQAAVPATADASATSAAATVRIAEDTSATDPPVLTILARRTTS